MTDLSSFLRPNQRADRLFNRNIPVQPVQIIEIDMIGIQPLQGAVECSCDCVGMPVQAAFAVVDIEHAFARQCKLVAPVADIFCQQGFVFSETIERGGVEHINAQIESVVQQLSGLFFGRCNAIGMVEIHASQHDG